MTVKETLVGIVILSCALPIALCKWSRSLNKTSMPRGRLFLVTLTRVICDASNPAIIRYILNPWMGLLSWLLFQAYRFPKHNHSGYWLRTAPVDRKPGVDKKLLLYVHGGGFMFGLIPWMLIVLWTVGKKLDDDVAILVLDYPVMANCPETIDYVWKEYVELTETFTEINLIGDSCGGNLILNILLKCHENKMTIPKRAIAISPWCNVLDRDSVDVERLNGYNVDMLSMKVLTVFQNSYMQNVVDPSQYLKYLNFTSIPRETWTEILSDTKLFITYGDLEMFKNQIELFINHISPNENLIAEIFPCGSHIEPLVLGYHQSLDKWAKFLSKSDETSF